MFIDSTDYALQGETMGMHKVRIVSLSPKAVCKQDGILEVPEKTAVNKPQSHREDEIGGRKKRHLLTS
ncbi:hypothetical protein T07_10537 [Trichinella nelsoni]|uniref:Uncharacterized protein n=1 Tax=Trichinella nelsoni TaxID=6336 RepID=A0A0V0RCI0_9BILA|nr:hypothetical protein T07_10537 [Trichinella nelsoni]